jgi:hypothetical protein
VWENITRDYKDECGVLFEADDFVCNYMICYYSETPRVYERVKNIMRCKVTTDGQGRDVGHHECMHPLKEGAAFQSRKGYRGRVESSEGEEGSISSHLA